MLTDNGHPQTGTKWTEVLRDAWVKSRSTEPDHPHQSNGTGMGRLGDGNSCDHLWKFPNEVETGETQDVSAFRFHFWEPIWCHVPSHKLPFSKLLPARYLCINETVGDAMTYYITTETPKGIRTQTHSRYGIRTRRKKIGTPDCYVNNDCSLEEDATLTKHKLECLIKEGMDTPSNVADTNDPTSLSGVHPSTAAYDSSLESVRNPSNEYSTSLPCPDPEPLEDDPEDDPESDSPIWDDSAPAPPDDF